MATLRSCRRRGDGQQRGGLAWVCGTRLLPGSLIVVLMVGALEGGSREKTLFSIGVENVGKKRVTKAWMQKGEEQKLAVVGVEETVAAACHRRCCCAHHPGSSAVTWRKRGVVAMP
jgi:hypothetical protein